MKLVFADTLYWGAALHKHDQYRAQVIRAREMLGEIHVVTTDEVLTERPNFWTGRLGGAACNCMSSDSTKATVLWTAFP